MRIGMPQVFDEERVDRIITIVRSRLFLKLGGHSIDLVEALHEQVERTIFEFVDGLETMIKHR